MAAPFTVTIDQFVPECPYRTPSGVNGSITVDSSCCHQYANKVSVNKGTIWEKILTYQGAVGPAQVWSTDSFKICGSDGTAGGNHSGTGTITGSNFEGTGTGLVTGGSMGGAYVVNIEGSFSSPGNGTFTGNLVGALVGTLSGSVVGGVVTGLTYAITYPNDTTAVSTSASFTETGGGTTFSFTGVIQITGPPPTLAYYVLSWTNCDLGGILLEMFLDADDSLIATWSNIHFSMWFDTNVVISRTYVSCDNPCLGIVSTSAQLSYLEAMCFRGSFINNLP